MNANENGSSLTDTEHSVMPEDGFADPIKSIEQDHAMQYELCNVLERIADSLPDNVDTDLVRGVIPILRHGFSQHMQFEDDVFFPMLRQCAFARPELNRVLDQLADEHELDEFYGHELADELEALSRAGRAAQPDMLGYMLRGFFQSQHRHIEWEDAVLLPLAREVLTRADMRALHCQMLTNTTAVEARTWLRRVAEIVPTTDCSGKRANFKKER